jgi:E3 ubiquitin-protein ligase BAH
MLDGETSESRHLRPKLTVFIHLRDGVAVDASLTPATRNFLEKIASRTVLSHDALSQADTDSLPSPVSTRTSSSFESICETLAAIQQVEVPLVFDTQFFDILQNEVCGLDKLQAEEQKKLHQEIALIGQDLSKMTAPSRSRKSKRIVAAWRDMFQLYLDARVFFSAREKDHGARSSSQALQQLQWFQDQVLQRKLLQNLKHEKSQRAYSSFLHLNAMLLQHVKFQEINRLAVAKILKSSRPFSPPP